MLAGNNIHLAKKIPIMSLKNNLKKLKQSFVQQEYKIYKIYKKY